MESWRRGFWIKLKKSPPLLWCLSRVLAFCPLSVLFSTLALHHPDPTATTHPVFLSLSLLCVCWLMSLSLCLDSVRHCVTSCLQTHRLRDNITVAQRLGEGGSKERQMYRQSNGAGGGEYFSHINHWLCAEKPARCSSSILRPNVPLLMNARPIEPRSHTK